MRVVDQPPGGLGEQPIHLFVEMFLTVIGSIGRRGQANEAAIRQRVEAIASGPESFDHSGQPGFDFGR
jgi:hypothetical protein